MVKRNKKIHSDDGFLMSPKNDFAFKLLFGNENHKELLIAFLNAILKTPENELVDIELINTELLREFAEDRKGILDVRAKTKNGVQIDIEIQVLYTEYMAERTIFYWSKMYTGQIKSGDTYDKLKKCITINIVDFTCIPIEKLHTCFHITEDETGKILTDVLEIHFLELPKLMNTKIPKDENDALVEWMMFLEANNKEALEMLSKKNDKIKKAYNVLQIISKDDKARAAYEAREAELHDQMTRIKSAREEGANEKAIEIAKNLLDILDIETIALKTGLSIDRIKKLKN